MNLFTRVDRYLDYNNIYTMEKAIRTLLYEFNRAISRKDKPYTNEVINTLRQVYDKLSLIYRESEDYGETMSHNQRQLAKKMRQLIAHLHKKSKSTFSIVGPQDLPYVN